MMIASVTTSPLCHLSEEEHSALKLLANAAAGLGITKSTLIAHGVSPEIAANLGLIPN